MIMAAVVMDLVVHGVNRFVDLFVIRVQGDDAKASDEQPNENNGCDLWSIR